MARLVKNIFGIASKMAGVGDVFETDEEEKGEVKEEGNDSKLDEADQEEEEEEEREGSNEGGEDQKMFSSSEEDETQEVPSPSSPPQKMAALSKWTNYISGWQERYVVVRDGILSYYKSEVDLQYGCRGSISLQKVKIFLHEFDDVRFDIRAHDCTYFFRAFTSEEKTSWVETIEANKKYLNECNLKRTPITKQASLLSLSGLSQASTSSFKTGYNLKVKLAEMETYRDILCRQIDILQTFFDASVDASAVNGIIENSTESIDESPEENASKEKSQFESDRNHLSTPSSPLTRSGEGQRFYTNGNTPSSNNSPLTGRLTPKGHRRTGSDPFAFRQNPPHLMHSRSSHVRFSVGTAAANNCNSPPDISNVDFRGEAITFKATTAGILSSLSYCIDAMNKREEYWQKKFEKEQERRRKAERAAHSALNGPRIRAYEYAGPDFQEGPHSALNEDEFFDALEMAYQEDEFDATENGSPVKCIKETETENETNDSSSNVLQKIEHKPLIESNHRLKDLVNENVVRYAKYIFEPVDSTTGNWQLAHEDNDMKVYRRELEEDGVVVDPLKAQYVVKGLTGSEMCKYFFEKDTRLEWEGTIESFSVLETLAEDTLVFHQLHKRVWPSTQRETVFCSHMCTLPNAPRPENMIGHTWMVCNFSIDHISVPVTSKLIRATINIGLVCQTISNKKTDPGKESDLTRDDISCKIIYAANVNPGGWAPPSVVRTIAKREITKFLKKISACAHKAISNQPLTL